MTDPGSLALVALLLPAAAFLILALAYPLRRSGRAAGLVSIAGAAGALVAALRAWTLQTPEGRSTRWGISTPSRVRRSAATTPISRSSPSR
jgi:multisubunit Na+/H+ antiporter MnhB subunit